MEFEDHLEAAEALVRRIESGNLRLTEAIEAFRGACEHTHEAQRLLEAARAEVNRLVESAATHG